MNPLGNSWWYCMLYVDPKPGLPIHWISVRLVIHVSPICEQNVTVFMLNKKNHSLPLQRCLTTHLLSPDLDLAGVKSRKISKFAPTIIHKSTIVTIWFSTFEHNEMWFCSFLCVCVPFWPTAFLDYLLFFLTFCAWCTQSCFCSLELSVWEG